MLDNIGQCLQLVVKKNTTRCSLYTCVVLNGVPYAAVRCVRRLGNEL